MKSRTFTTLQDVKNDDEQKIRNTINTLSNKIKELKINEFKNKRYINALEEQIKQLSTQLKELKQTPKLDLTAILRDINETTAKEQGMSKSDMEALDKEIEQKIKSLMN